MRRLGILPCVAMLGCRGLLGIEDPTVGGDGGPRTDGTTCTGDDYDGDGTPDSCDPCPMFGTADADHDTDGDGVGDGCDPNPQDKGDERVLWTHFASASDIATWSVLGGTWTVESGKLKQSDGMGNARITLPDTYRNVHIATEIDLVARGTSPHAGACGYVSTNSFKCCDVREETFGVVELMAWNAVAMSVTDWSGGLQPGTAFELTNTAHDTTHECFVRRQALNTKIPLNSATEPAGKIVLHTAEAAVAYRYLFVVQMPP